MGKFDRHLSMKMKRRKAQSRKKAREKRRRTPLKPSKQAPHSTPAPDPTPRMSFKSRPAPPSAPPTRMTVAIADLVPLEGAVIEPNIAYFREALKQRRLLLPPEVVVIGAEHVVVDGNNRVYAAKLEGLGNIEVAINHKNTNEAYRRDKLGHALRRRRKGFENIVVVATESDRTKFTERERLEDEKFDFGR